MTQRDTSLGSAVLASLRSAKEHGRRLVKSRASMKCRGALSAVLAWLVLTCLADQACAIDASMPLGLLERTTFHAREGAPGNIQAVAQANDGIIWLGTSGDLYQFDGVSFRRYQPPGMARLPDSNIATLAAAPDGGIWATTRLGRVYYINQKSLRIFGSSDGLPEHTLYGLALDIAGHVWVGSRFGVFRLVENHWVQVRNDDGTTSSAYGLDCLKLDGHGNLWTFAPPRVSVLRPNSDHFEFVRTTDLTEGIFVDKQGEAWLSDEKGIYSLSNAKIGIPAAQLPGLPARNGFAHSYVYFIDSAGMAWGLTPGGSGFRVPLPQIAPVTRAMEVRPSEKPFSENEFPVDVAIRPYWLEDFEGNVWITSSSGLDRLRATKFRRVTVDGTAVGSGSLAVSSSGALWAESATGVYRRLPGGLTQKVDIGRSQRCADCVILAARDGTLYRGGGRGLERLGRSGFAEVAQTTNPAKGGAYHAILEDDAGRIWASITPGKGVFVLSEGKWARFDAGGQTPEPAVSISSSGGRIWLGYVHGNVIVVQGDATRRLDARNGLAIGDVLTVAAQGTSAWFAGTNGVAYFDGERVHTLLARRRPWIGVSGLVLTPEGDLWLNDLEGVQRVTRAELAAFIHDPTYQVTDELFDIHAGIEGTPVQFNPIPTAARTPDGVLWFTTSAGLFSVDPARLANNRVAPHVAVLGIRSNDAQFTGDMVRLPAGSSAIEINYTAPILGVPELAQFKYRLEGVDAGWQDAGDRRRAFYTNLSPGSYRFQVMAANEDGLWSQHPADVTIEIAPAWWQTAWFRAGVGLLATLSIASGVLLWHRLRVRRLSRALRQEADIQQAERERIARDLHDTLMQNMYGLVWRMDVISRRFPAGDENRSEMGEALDRAEKALGASRERMFSPQAPEDDGGRTLVERLMLLGRTWSTDTGIGFEAVVRDERPLRAGVTPLLGRILSEAIVNAFRHSEASIVTLTLQFEPDVLRCSVTDDGAGVPLEFLENSPDGHLGLRLMRERAVTIGARLLIRRLDAGGSAIDLTLPSRKAYVRSPFGRRLVAAWRSVRRSRRVVPAAGAASMSADV